MPTATLTATTAPAWIVGSANQIAEANRVRGSAASNLPDLLGPLADALIDAPTDPIRWWGRFNDVTGGALDGEAACAATQMLAALALEDAHATAAGEQLTADDATRLLDGMQWDLHEDATGLGNVPDDIATAGIVDAYDLIVRGTETARDRSMEWVDLGDGYGGIISWRGEGIVLDIFAGPGGWSEGLRSNGIDDIGVEWDPWACETRAANGHSTIQGDVAGLNLRSLRGKVTSLIASPPCQSFSAAGDRAGFDDPRGKLMWQLERYALELQPQWICAEQVPTATTKAFFEKVAATLANVGYHTWVGVLNAADYGVPQTRKRLILMAALEPFDPPTPTHSQHGPTLLEPDLQPWVTMVDAVGWGCTDRPARTIPSQRPGSGERLEGGSGARNGYATEQQAGRWKPRFNEDGTQHPKDIKAATGDGGTIGKPPVADVGALQGFRRDYRWQGPRKAQLAQVGNAVPPPLAAAITAALAR